jgi:acetyltransferase-like isoleucine patch superfamily enzyme
VVTRGTEEPRCLLMGNPARVVRKEMNWERRPGLARPIAETRQN